MNMLLFWLAILTLTCTSCESFLASSSSPYVSSRLHARSSASSDLILQQAAAKRDVDRRRVIECLSTVKGGKVQADDVKGRWEIVFSSIPGGAAEGFLVGGVYDNAYFAIKEVINFASDFESIELNTPLGSFKGLAGISPKQSPFTIEYEFEKFIPLNFPLLSQEIPLNRRSYTFNYLKDGIAVCRTSSSSLILLKKL